MVNAGVGGPPYQVLGCPLEGGGLRREAETLTSLDPKPNSHSSCIALFYGPFIALNISCHFLLICEVFAEIAHQFSSVQFSRSVVSDSF